VVLTRAQSGEGDLVVTFLTRERGLLTGLAKNARQSQRRFGGGLLYPGRAAWYDFRIRERAEVCFVERGEINPKAPDLPQDPVLFALYSWALELVRAFEAPGQPAPAAFNLLLRHLMALSGLKTAPAPALRARELSLAFTISYLALAGFGLDFENCRRCRKKLCPRPESRGGPDPLCLGDVPSGGLICPDCAPPGLSGGAPKAISLGLSQKLLALQAQSGLSRGQIREEEMAKAENFIREVASFQAGRAFKSPKAIRGLLEGKGYGQARA
jgi:DNA repair protein RecO (recombination protein O)